MSYDTIVGPPRSYSPSASAVADEPEAHTQDEPQDGSGMPRELRAGIRILVIDDDRTLREGCSSVLQVEVYNVTSCGRGD